MATRGQKVAEEIRETIERRLAARVAANDVDAVREILYTAQYAVDIAAGSLDRMGFAKLSDPSQDTPETGWSAPSAIQQQLIAERDAAIANAKRERDLHVREENDYEAALKLVSEERDALRENSRIQGQKIEELIESRNHYKAELNSALEAITGKMHDNGKPREAKVTPQVPTGVESGNGQPAQVLGIVKVHSGDDIPEPTPPPKVRKPSKAPEKATEATPADKWGKAQYAKQTDPESGQKLYNGKGVAVHPSKKKQYKIQGEKDPDTKNARAMVAVLRPHVLNPVFPSIPADLDKVSQIITPRFDASVVPVEKVPTWTPNPADPDAYKKYQAERERITKENAEKRQAAQERFEAEQVQMDQERTRKLSQGNLPAYKALKFWVHHTIKETRGLTAADRGEMFKRHREEISDIADQVAREHNTTRPMLSAWVQENIDTETGVLIDNGRTLRAA